MAVRLKFDNWNSYGSQETSAEAKATLSALVAVPTDDGGIQIELHAGGADVEIHIDLSGNVTGASYERRGR